MFEGRVREHNAESCDARWDGCLAGIRRGMAAIILELTFIFDRALLTFTILSLGPDADIVTIIVLLLSKH